MSTRTFKLQKPPVKGDDVKAWEKELKGLFADLGIRAPIVDNGVYASIDRSYARSFVYAIGLDPDTVLKNGVTPEVRTMLRHWHERITPEQTKRIEARKDWRIRLKKRYHDIGASNQGHTSTFLDKLLQDSWGFHPGVHDGIDLISLPDVPIHAPFDCKVIDVRDRGWWGLGAPKDPILKAKGDGIVQLEVLKDVGPVKKGWHIGLGHAEKARVKVGQVVKAGTWVANTGFANAWHIHCMLNNGAFGLQGRGNIDPLPMVNYTIKHDR
jgi:murein DD-endopeptidase MepM/ murein hydrolase activator NlpD